MTDFPLDAKRLDEIHRMVIAKCPPTPADLEHLTKIRGFDFTQVALRGYGTINPNRHAWRTFVSMFKNEIPHAEFKRIPGVFYDPGHDGKGEWKIIHLPGILIPYRNLDGLIVGFAVRDAKPDADNKYKFISAAKRESGVGITLCVHVPLSLGLIRDQTVVRITEGALKADIIQSRTGIRTIGIPGVSTWELSIEVIKKINPRRVLVAFDMDYKENEHVKRSLISLVRRLLAFGSFEVVVETWDGCKGRDDLALVGKEAVEVPAAEFLDRLGTGSDAGSVMAKPEFILNGAPMFDTISGIWTLVRDRNQPPALFLYNNNIAEIISINGIQTICLHDVDLLRGYLIRIANFFHQTKDRRENTDPNEKILRDMLRRPDQYALHELYRLSLIPVLGEKKILLVSGYHPDEKIYLSREAEVLIKKPIPELPDKEDLEEAVTFLKEIFSDFPLGKTDIAHLIAAILTQFVRDLIQGPTPLFVIEATSGGSGKTLLVNLICLIVFGTPAELKTLSAEEAEQRKLITTSLLNGGYIAFDNTEGKDGKGKIHSPVLAAAITCPIWSDRLLGTPRIVTARNNVLWLMTANNPSYSSEIIRRTVRIRLVPKEESPWLRSGYKIKNIENWVSDNRAEIVHAIMIILQAWHAAGRPTEEEGTIGSFGSWSKIMGGILKTAGIDGFLDNINDYYNDSDEEIDELRAFTFAWREHLGTLLSRTPTELHQLCKEHSLMRGFLGDGNEDSQRTKLGMALSKLRDRTIGDLTIKLYKGDGKHGRLYRLSGSSGDLPPTSPQGPQDEKSVETKDDSAQKTLFGGPGDVCSNDELI